jgi:NitT/TauT family transport system permease protein
VAIIPIIVLIVGASVTADAVAAFVVVFFIVFYNAYAGAASIPTEMIQSSHILGASKTTVMWKVRLPYAVVWTVMALPNAIAFGLTTVVTAGIFSGGAGLGYQLVLAIDSENATLLFSIVVLLAVMGVILVQGSSWLRRVLMPWWESSEGV